MAKRFTATEIWSEDWFLEMPMEYKLSWYYMLAKCDHAGIFKVNFRSFSGQLGVNLTSKIALNHFNGDKQRVRVISDSVWYVEDFFVYQYGAVFNPNNRLHDSIGKIYEKHGIKLTSIRGLKEVKDGVKVINNVLDNTVTIDNTITNLIHEPKNFNYKPKASDFNGLPEIKIGSVVQLFKITKQVDVSKSDVKGLWEIFKDQNLNGKKFYTDEDAVYSHFLNWTKTQKIENATGDTKNSRKLSPGEARQIANRDY